jgi:hypothetical protein
MLAHPIDPRVPRNGGCYLLFHSLRAGGARILYEPGALVAHGFDPLRPGFFRKHFDRGYDSVVIYGIDDAFILRGTRIFRRLGILALVPIFIRRTLLDWGLMFSQRRQMGVTLPALPLYATIGLGTRAIEFGGACWAAIRGARPRPA